MKRVPITCVFDGVFFDKGKKYKITGGANTRIYCCEFDDPKKEIQFSSYSTVEVEDEDAKSILFIMKHSLRDTKSRLFELRKGIKSLIEQGVKSPF